MAGVDAIDLIEGIVAIFRFPQRASEWINGDAEAVADAIGKYFLQVGAHFAAHRLSQLEEWIVVRCRAVIIQSQHHAGEMIVVRLRPAKLIVRNARPERAVD